MFFGRTAEGDLVMISRFLSGDTRAAQIGDVFSFIPEEPRVASRSGMKWFGKHPALVSRDAKPSQPGEGVEEPLAEGLARVVPIASDGGLPNAHTKNFDSRGAIRFGPRPAELAAQRRNLLGT